MKVIRVANVIEVGKLGGPQVRIANVANALKGRVETTVVFPKQNSSRFREKLDGYEVGYKQFSLSHISKDKMEALRYIAFSWLEVFQLYRFFRRERFDLIHNSGGSWQNKAVLAGVLAGNKVIWHLNDTSMPWFLRKLFSVFSSLPIAYIYASHRTKEYYRNLIRHSVLEYVIPAPVDTARFSPDREYEGDEDLIEQFGTRTVIGVVANVSPVKGLDIFIRLAAELNKFHKELYFLVIGAVEDSQKGLFDELRKIIDDNEIDNILFAGPRNDTRALINRMDVYVCTSYAESSPISVWEAMSMGKAIVSADVGDVGVYIKGGENGYLVDIADIEAFSESVSTLVRDEALRKSYGLKARKVAIDRLDIEYCADRHYSAYIECAEG